MSATAVITREHVESSNIDSIGYSEETRTLEVAFIRKSAPESPSVYRYANVPPELWAEFQAAESKGRFFKDRIKNNSDYPFTKIS